MTSAEAVDALRSAWPDDVTARRSQGGRQSRRRRGPGGPEARRRRLVDRIDQFRRRLTRRVADIDYLAAAPLGPKEGVVLVWAGMRGVVTLAAAQTLPPDFPQRSLLVLIAFGVAAGTLLVQGGTLPWVVRRLGLAGVESPTAVDHAAGLRAVLHDAVVDLMDGDGPTRADGTRYAPEVLARGRRVTAKKESEQDEAAAWTAELSAQIVELRVQIIEAQRAALLRARADGTFDSAVLAAALAQLDADQIAVELRGDS